VKVSGASVNGSSAEVVLHGKRSNEANSDSFGAYR
jgi:hypothetical protein